jgi:hypothetical protein
VAPIVATESWVTDGTYGSLGTLIAERTNLIVWLDLPPWVWLPRLLKRSARRLIFREVLWNGNRETLRGVFLEADGVIPHALRAYFFRRHGIPARLAPYASCACAASPRSKPFSQRSHVPLSSDRDRRAANVAKTRSTRSITSAVIPAEACPRLSRPRGAAAQIDWTPARRFRHRCGPWRWRRHGGTFADRSCGALWKA